MPSNFDIFLLEQVKAWALTVIFYEKQGGFRLNSWSIDYHWTLFNLIEKTVLKIAGLLRRLINFTSAFDSMDMFFKLCECKISLQLLICLQNLHLWYHCQNQARQQFKCIRKKKSLGLSFYIQARYLYSLFKEIVSLPICKNEEESNYPSL